MIKLDSIKNILSNMVLLDPKYKEGYIRANWTKIVGDLSSSSQVKYLKNSTLHIIVANSAMLHFMRMNTNTYINKINNLFDEFYSEKNVKDSSNKTITNLSLTLGNIENYDLEE